jgi:hypothetical protein
MTSRSVLPAVFLLLGALSACTGSGRAENPAPSPTTAANAGLGDRATSGPTAATVRDVDQLIFLTPSRNIGCDLRADMVRCDIGRKDWAPPAKPADCGLDWGNGVYVEKTGRANFTCAGDSLLGGTTVLLPYGQAVRAGAFVCDSELAALHCQNEKTGHGFTLAIRDYHLS